MIPYIDLHELGLESVPVFAILIAAALVSGYVRAVRRARRAKLDLGQARWFSLWLILGGFAGAVLLKLAYDPQSFLAPSWLVRIRFRGIASFGGLFGGMLGAGAYFAARKIRFVEALRCLDVVAYVCPAAWAIGRAGCSLVHDHPGIRSTSWLAVRYPDWTRYDLGVLGFLYLLMLSALFLALDRRPRPPGFFLCVGCLLTGAFRLWLDRLHVDPPRYFGWTVDQYASLAMLACGATLIPFLVNRPKEEPT